MDRSYELNINNEELLFEGPEIDEQMIAEGEHRTAQFLFRSLGVIKSSCLSAPVLRSSYLLRLKALETVVFSKGSPKHCQFCYQPWSEGCFTLKVLPKRTQGKCVRRIMKKKLTNPSKLSKYEINLSKKVEGNLGNKLVLKCLKCRKDTVKMMPKHNRCCTTSEDEIVNTKKKKKRAPKDCFAGLNSQVVINSGVFKKQKLGDSNLSKINERGDNSVVNCKGLQEEDRKKSFLLKKDAERRKKVREENQLNDQCNLKRVQIIKKISKAPEFNNLKDFLRDFMKTENYCKPKIRTEIEKNLEIMDLRSKEGKGQSGGNSSLRTKKKKKKKKGKKPSKVIS